MDRGNTVTFYSKGTKIYELMGSTIIDFNLPAYMKGNPFNPSDISNWPLFAYVNVQFFGQTYDSAVFSTDYTFENDAHVVGFTAGKLLYNVTLVANSMNHVFNVGTHHQLPWPIIHCIDLAYKDKDFNI